MSLIYPFKVDLPRFWIGSLHSHSHRIAQADDRARVFADELLLFFVKPKTVSAKSFQPDQPVDVVLPQLDEQSEFRDAGDHPVKLAAQMPLHKPAFFHGFKFAFRFHGALLARGQKRTHCFHPRRFAFARLLFGKSVF